eukprot:RCo055751
MVGMVIPRSSWKSKNQGTRRVKLTHRNVRVAYGRGKISNRLPSKEEGGSYFADELVSQCSLNKTDDFREFFGYVWPLCSNEGALRRNYRKIMEVMAQYLTNDCDAALSVCKLAPALARDLGAGFLPHLLPMLKSTAGVLFMGPTLVEQNTDTLRTVFTVHTMLLKSVLIALAAEPRTLKELFRLYFTLLGDQRQHIRRLSAETLAAMFRGVEDPRVLSQVFTMLFSEFRSATLEFRWAHASEEDSTSMVTAANALTNGLGKLLFFSVMGPTKLRENFPEVFKLILEQMEICKVDSEESCGTYFAVRQCFALLCDTLDSEKFEPVWPVLAQEISAVLQRCSGPVTDEEGRVKATLQLTRVLQLLGSALFFVGGRLVRTPSCV